MFSSRSRGEALALSGLCICFGLGMFLPRPSRSHISMLPSLGLLSESGVGGFGGKWAHLAGLWAVARRVALCGCVRASFFFLKVVGVLVARLKLNFFADIWIRFFRKARALDRSGSFPVVLLIGHSTGVLSLLKVLSNLLSSSGLAVGSPWDVRLVASTPAWSVRSPR